MLKPVPKLAMSEFVMVRIVALMVALLLMPGSTLAAEEESLLKVASGLLKTPATDTTATQPSGISSATVLKPELANQPQKPAPLAVFAQPVKDKQVTAAGQQAAADGPKLPQTVAAAGASGPAVPPPAEDQKQDGQKVSGVMNLNFFNADIQQVLSALAMQHEINIISSKDVTGPISIHLYRVTLSEALDAVAMASGFSYLMRGDSYYFYKPKAEKDPQSEKLAIRVFKLKYADSWKTEDFEKVKEILSAIPGMRTISIHESSKTIIVEDTPQNIKKIEQVIGFWDTMPKHVMIEVKILEITLTDAMQMGVRWDQLLGDAHIGTGGLSTATLPTNAGFTPITGLGIFGSFISGVGTTTQFAVAVDALQTKTDVNTVSAPKILAIHGRKATVQVGGKEGYRTTVVEEGVVTEKIEFIPTGTILEITPFIDDQDNVLMDVTPTITTAGKDETGIPVVNTTTVTTRLLAKSGETVFIGGLIRNAIGATKNQVPCLGDIPLLGIAFAREENNLSKRELVILITPYVIQQDIVSHDRQEALQKMNDAEIRFKKK